jgi:hypothetical protein
MLIKSKDLFIFVLLYEYLLSLLGTPGTYLVPIEARKWHHIPWSQTCRCLWAITRNLGAQPNKCFRHWAISPAPVPPSEDFRRLRCSKLSLKHPDQNPNPYETSKSVTLRGLKICDLKGPPSVEEGNSRFSPTLRMAAKITGKRCSQAY